MPKDAPRQSAPHTVTLDNLLEQSENLVYWGVLVSDGATSLREVTDLHTVFRGRLCAVLGRSDDTYYCEQIIRASEGDWISFRLDKEFTMRDVELDHGFLDDIE